MNISLPISLEILHECLNYKHKHAWTFLYLVIAFKKSEFEDDEENGSCSGGSNVYSQRLWLFWINMCMHASTMSINVHAYFYICQ